MKRIDIIVNEDGLNIAILKSEEINFLISFKQIYSDSVSYIICGFCVIEVYGNLDPVFSDHETRI